MNFNHKKIASKALALSLCVFLISGCSSKDDTEEASAKTTPAISVEVKNVKPERIEEYLNVSAKVTAENEVYVIPKVSGTVKSVNVNLGDTVKAGDVLFTIDSASASLQFEQSITSLESSIAAYEIQYNSLLDSLEDTKVLFELGEASQSDLDKLNDSIKSMEIQINTSKESLRITKENANLTLGYYTVRSEIDGVVSSSNVTVGSMASQTALMTIVSMDKVKLSFNVSSDVINKIAPGSKAYVTVSSVGDEVIETEVSYISPAATSQTMLYPAEIYIDNLESDLKPGMFASIKVVLSSNDEALVIPINACIDKNGEKYVYTVDENNIAHKVIVETGIENDKYIEIVSGLNTNDTVVVVGQDFLSEGTSVNITEAY